MQRCALKCRYISVVINFKYKHVIIYLCFVIHILTRINLFLRIWDIIRFLRDYAFIGVDIVIDDFRYRVGGKDDALVAEFTERTKFYSRRNSNKY